MPRTAAHPLQASLLEWLRSRARLWPGALDEVAGPAREAYAHEWAPVQLLGQRLACLPDGLWPTLLQWESGYVLLHAGESRYEPGSIDLRGRALRGVALVSLVDCAGHAPNRVLHVVGHLIDHHLGCGGGQEGAWLSEGGGMTGEWQRAGERLRGLFGLGYGCDEQARSSAREYFAQSLAAYCRDRRALGVADPQAAKWLRTTLWDKRFWTTRREM